MQRIARLVLLLVPGYCSVGVSGYFCITRLFSSWGLGQLSEGLSKWGQDWEASQELPGMV